MWCCADHQLLSLLKWKNNRAILKQHLRKPRVEIVFEDDEFIFVEDVEVPVREAMERVLRIATWSDDEIVEEVLVTS